MDASDTPTAQATKRDVSTAGDSDAQVVCEQTKADIVPLFADEDTFVERALGTSDRAITEPFTQDEDDPDPGAIADLRDELDRTRRELARAVQRADTAEKRVRTLAAELAQREADHKAIVQELECHGASAVAATYLWFVRNNR